MIPCDFPQEVWEVAICTSFLIEFLMWEDYVIFILLYVFSCVLKIHLQDQVNSA